MDTGTAINTYETETRTAWLLADATVEIERDDGYNG